MAVSAAWIGAAAAVGGVATAQDSSRKASHAVDDQNAAKALAETSAATSANARIAMQRKAMQQNSLLTGAGDAPGVTPGTRSTLGV